jgi:hypothetical protein
MAGILFQSLCAVILRFRRTGSGLVSQGKNVLGTHFFYEARNDPYADKLIGILISKVRSGR